MFVVYCSLRVGWCSLLSCVVCSLLRVDHCVLFVGCMLWFVGLLRVVCCWLLVVSSS